MRGFPSRALTVQRIFPSVLTLLKCVSQFGNRQSLRRPGSTFSFVLYSLYVNANNNNFVGRSYENIVFRNRINSRFQLYNHL